MYGLQYMLYVFVGFSAVSTLPVSSSSSILSLRDAERHSQRWKSRGLYQATTKFVYKQKTASLALVHDTQETNNARATRMHTKSHSHSVTSSKSE